MSSMVQFAELTSAPVESREGLFSRLLTRLNTLWMKATYPFAGTGRGLRLHYQSEISRQLTPSIWLGNRVEIGRHSWLTLWIVRDRRIVIEDDCRIGPRCTVSAENSIRLERGVVLESDVLVMDHAHAYEDVSQPIKFQGATLGGTIRIEEGCRIGQGAAILCDKGELVLGRHSVVAPGSVVTRSFPANSVISGNLARVAGQFEVAKAYSDVPIVQQAGRV